MKLDNIIEIFKRNVFEVKQLEFHDVVNRDVKIENSIIIYSFSQKPGCRAYIVDLITYFSKFNNLVLPDLDFLNAMRIRDFRNYTPAYQKLISLLLIIFPIPQSCKHVSSNFLWFTKP